MKATYGAFENSMAQRLDQFKIMLHADRLAVKWTHCGLTADLLAAYYASEFAEGPTQVNAQKLSQDEMCNSVRYAINELVENAVKFRCSGDIQITSRILNANVVFLISNLTNKEGATKLQAWLERITAEDATDLMLQRIEENSQSDAHESGLGILMLLTDYGAVLGWSIESVDNEKFLVQTMVQLSMYKKDDTVVDSVGFHKPR